ncbi:hypothetical protein MAPG_02986 [Magnaporthiopsis poae ATCC 64411]|uniref:Uncharacterized protein n=1 Tax=Magnaporthiopsis poae (strain ATCC 64411 / 73-15) TaxID=644358 RepID=A0A0C4DSU5_MAGP6|nr:hypothetical protein MAPG_02986 [Magnaporthiopsis poae ATCC 64411]
MPSKRTANALAKAAKGTASITSFFPKRATRGNNAPEDEDGDVPAAPAAPLAAPASPPAVDDIDDVPIRRTRSRAKAPVSLDSDSDDKPLVRPVRSSGPSTRSRAKQPESDSDDKPLVPIRASGRITRSRAKEPSVASDDESGADGGSSKAPAKRKALASPVSPVDNKRRRGDAAPVPASPVILDEDEEALLSEGEDATPTGYACHNRRIAERFAKALDPAKVGKRTGNLLGAGLSDRMRAWINNEAVDIWEPISRRPAVPGRNYTPLVVKWDDPKGERSAWDLFAVQGRERRSFIRFPSSPDNEADSYTQEEAESLCSKLVEALQVWPDVNDITYLATLNNRIALHGLRGKGAIRSLVSAAHGVVFPSRPPLVNGCKPRPKGDLGASMFTFAGLVLVDPDTLVSTTCEKMVSASTLGLGPVIEVPRMGEAYIARGGNYRRTGRLADGSLESLIPEDWPHRDAAIRLESFVRLWRYEVSRLGSFMTIQDLETMKEMVLHRVRQTVPQPDLFPKVYRGYKLLGWERGGCQGMAVTLSKIVRNDLGIYFKGLHIRSMDRSWAISPIRTGHSTWMDTGDLARTVSAMAEEADRVNALIESGQIAPSTCRCSPETGHETTYPCGRCGSQTLCTRLQTGEFGIRVCGVCLPKQSAKDITFPSELSTIPLGESDDAIIAFRAAIVDKLRSTAKAGVWYTSEFTGRETITYRRPEKMSIDALFPVGRHPAGGDRVGVHVPGNVAVVEVALNFCKSTALPVSIQAISDYASIDKNAVPDPEALASTLVDDCRRYTAIRKKYPRLRADRLELQVSDRQLEYDLEEQRSGKWHEGRSPSDGNIKWGFRITTRRPGLPEFRRLASVIHDIETWSGATLPKSKDGCPYFAHALRMPCNWNWEVCYGLMLQRFNRMRWNCNRKHPTVDIAFTIYLECVFQVCVGRMDCQGDPTKLKLQAKYKEFLGLPLDVDSGNPLCFAVAHRVHGQQMRTGWATDPEKRSLEQRVRDDEDNNVLIETRTSNFLKHTYHESVYPLLIDLFKSIKMPKSMVDFEMVPGPYDPELDRGAFGMWTGDGWEGEEDEDEE